LNHNHLGYVIDIVYVFVVIVKVLWVCRVDGVVCIKEICGAHIDITSTIIVLIKMLLFIVVIVLCIVIVVGLIVILIRLLIHV